MMLYSTAKPDCNTAGFRDPSVRALLGKATPTRPVIASGLSHGNPCGKSPKPLPKNSPGIHVLKVCSHLFASRAADIHVEADRDHGFVFVVLKELVFRADGKIAEAIYRLAL